MSDDAATTRRSAGRDAPGVPHRLPPLLTGIFRYTRTWPLAAHLVASGQVDVDALVTGRFDLDHAGDALGSDTDPHRLKSVVEPWR